MPANHNRRLMPQKAVFSRLVRPLLLLLLLANAAPAVAFTSALGAFTGGPDGGQGFLPVDEALPFSSTVSTGGLLLHWDIAPEHYLYRGRVSVTPVTDGVSVSGVDFSRTGEVTEDPYFGTVTVFYKPVEARVSLQLPEGAREATLQVSYQGCAKAGLCYPPQTREVLYYAGSGDKSGTANAKPSYGQDSPASTPSGRAGASSQDLTSATGLVGFLSQQPITVIALVFLGLGLGLTFTPCVLPMVPIISSLVSSQNTRNTTQALLLALSYVLGMALTYAAAGVITGSLGASFNLQAHLQSPWVLGVFAALFILFALAMFNVFDLQLPAAVQNRLNQASQNLSGGRIASVFGIGSLSALVVSPCVSAPLAGSLLYISTTQDALVGGVALFSMGLGMGIPLILVAVGGRKLLPRAGAWMNVVKGFYGVMLLAVAIWLLERIVPAWLALTLWGLLAGITGVQLGAFEQARAGWQRTWKGLGLVMFAWGLALLAGALGGATDPTRPLTPFLATGSDNADTDHAAFQRVEDPDRLRVLLADARRQQQPVLLDFYADWCISCKIMEREVFSQPSVVDAMGPYTLLQIDLTDNTPAQQAFLEELELFGPPAILFYNHDGEEDPALRVLGEMDKTRFLDHLREVKAAHTRA